MYCIIILYIMYQRKTRRTNKTGNYIRFICFFSLRIRYRIWIFCIDLSQCSRLFFAVLTSIVSSGHDIFTAVYFPLPRRGPSPTDSNKTLRASRRANRATLRLRNLFFSWELASSCALSLSLFISLPDA